MFDIFLHVNKENDALVYHQTTITYGELMDRVNDIADELVKAGIQKETHVVIKVKNSLRFVEYFLALWQINATIIPIDSQVSDKNLLEIAKESDSSFCIVDETNRKTVQQLSRIGTTIEKVTNQDILIVEFNHPTTQFNWFQRNKIESPFGYLLLFTSGTSGQPKGVVLGKDSFINNVRKVINYTALTDADSLYLILPLSYSFGLSELFAHLLVGAKVFLSDTNKLTMNILHKLKDLKVTNYAATPYFYHTLSKGYQHKQEAVETNLKFLMCSGGHLSEQAIRNILDLFPGVTFFYNYGQTEASPRLLFNQIIYPSDNLKAAGKPIDGVEIKLFDENNNPISDQQVVGEVGYKSEDIMIGYYNMDVLDRNAFYQSGDLGYYDENNDLIIVGRKDSLIKVNGRKIYKNEIEDRIGELSFIKDIQLKVETHDLYGQYFVAYVVLNHRIQVSEAVRTIKAFCMDNLNKYEIPRKIVTREKVVLNSNQKAIIQKEDTNYELYENG